MAVATTTTLARIASLALFFVHTVLLIAYHVRALENNDKHHLDGSSSSLVSALVAWMERLKRHGPYSLTTMDKVMLAALVTMGFELLDFVAKNWGKWLDSKLIPVRGKHLDDLSAKDILFIGFSKANTAPFTYIYFSYAYHHAPQVIWSVPTSSSSSSSSLTFTNTVVAATALFLVFDFTYVLLHWILHIKCVYEYIHKHHHQQKAPSRAVVDAINVHPIEYILGEYNHVLALYIVNAVWHIPVHAVTTLGFLIVGGMLAALNHTRYDIVLAVPVPWMMKQREDGSSTSTDCYANRSGGGGEWYMWHLYDTKVHDVHHRIPQSNYGQYTMFWDWIFGTFRAYDPNDRINPDAQLDPRTGKSLLYSKRRKAQ